MSAGRCMLVLNMMDIARRRGIEIDMAKLGAELGVPVVSSVAVRRGGVDALLGEVDRALVQLAEDRSGRLAAAGRRRVARRPARGRSHPARRAPRLRPARQRHQPRRRDPAASRRRPGDPARHPVRDVPGGVRLGAAVDGRHLRRLHLARRAWSARRRSARSAAQLPQGRRDRRRRQRDRVPAADRDPVLLHPAARRPGLHGAGGLPDGQDHGRRRPARPRLHSAALVLRLRHPGHHGDARDRRPPRSADHHPGGAADDLLGAHPGLYADHLGLHSRPRGLGLSSACRGW